MARAYVSIGSNINRQFNIRASIAALRARYRDLQVSTVYACPAEGFEGCDFFNLVVGFNTDENARAIYRLLRDIEDCHGRDRTLPKYASRTLDLDLLTYGDLVIKEDGLHLPREEIEKYAFVLGPLAEIAPQERHPTLGLTYGEMWDAFDPWQKKLTPLEFD